MAKTLIFVGIFGFLVAATLSFPSVEEDQKLETPEEMQAPESGNSELVIDGQNLGRADLTKLTGLFNFSSYLTGRTPNATQLGFVPLITILSSLTG